MGRLFKATSGATTITFSLTRPRLCPRRLQLRRPSICRKKIPVQRAEIRLEQRIFRCVVSGRNPIVQAANHCRKPPFSLKSDHHQELGLAALTNLPNRARWFADVALRGNQADALMRASRRRFTD